MEERSPSGEVSASEPRIIGFETLSDHGHVSLKDTSTSWFETSTELKNIFKQTSE
jgi:hypothetical protein